MDEFNKIPIGEETMVDFDNLFMDSELLPTREQIESLSNSMPFRRGLIARMVSCGYEGDATDIETALCYLRRCCDEAGVSILEETVRNWLVGKQPAPREDKRENIYKLCFALKMNADEVKSFFLKAYFSRPFNYKSIYEATCFYCINTGRTYSDVLRLEGVVKAFEANESSEFEFTEEIGCALADITDEEDFMRFMADNRAVFDERSSTAGKRVRIILDRCYDIATRYCERFLPHEEHKKVASPDALLHVIYGYAARATEDGKKSYLKSISKSNFPTLIRVNFPQRQQIRNIMNGTASYDVLRKALIMLHFFHFFAEFQLNGGNLFDVFEEFERGLNAELNNCGYIQLYWKNPYDWMIGHCAASEEPLERLRELIDEFYLDNEEIYSE